ncbi:MAG: hypothetical protein QME85_11730 [Candidatus Saccharicenans sp.]|nr:hypothetical protein [Candidatus Saccharicenans sp.]
MKINVLIIRYLFILIICKSFLYPFQEPEVSVTKENWKEISSRLSRFLAAPTANFADIKKIEDLSYWTDVYDEINGGSYIKALFSRHFKVEDIDNTSMEIIYYLLNEFAYPANWWEDYGIKPIIKRIIEITKAKPEWFFEDLVKRDCWKQYLRLILLDGSNELKRFLDFIPSSYSKQEILNFIEIYEEEKRTEVQRLEEFLLNPIDNFELIKNIYCICSVMYTRDKLYIDENKNLPDEYFSAGVIEDYIRESPDEEKIKILIHLILHCIPSGVYPYVLAELGSEMFFEYPELFARSLSVYKRWRSIIYGLKEFIFARDPGYKKVISRLGKTEFEKKLKDELIFLSSLIEKKYGESHEN